MLNKADVQRLRELAQRYAQAASLPAQSEKRELWRSNNELRSARPMVLIDQICWSEIYTDGSLSGKVQDPYWRGVEENLLLKLYCWEHFPVDMVLTPYISLPKPIADSGWGIDWKIERLYRENSDVASQRMTDILEDESVLEQIRMPEVTVNTLRMEQIRQEAETVFEGIIPFCLAGSCMHLGIWDTISFWRGVENIYFDLLDRPEYIHAIMEKVTQGLLSRLEQMNRLGCYDVTSTLVHCSHTFLDELPAKDTNPEFGTTQQGWAFGMAQLFSSVSPAVTEEFEVEYMKRIFPHFGAIYYGCCERLDDRLDIISKLPNIRKISCSPWSDREHFAEAMPDWCVMSVKPNPAFLAASSMDEDSIRKEFRFAIDAARRYNRNIEFLLKDISTIRHDPTRLVRWAQIAMEEVQR